MPKEPPVQPSVLRLNLIRLTRLHFLYVLAFAISIVVYDAWQLITAEAVLHRWIMAAAMLVVVTIIWYLARTSAKSPAYQTALATALVVIDIIFASFMVYAERGMASRGVALFAVPIIVSAVLFNRAALFATAALCTAAYAVTSVAYFVINFNEGFKIELYGTIGFYSACFFLFAGLLWAIIRGRKLKS